MSCNRPLLEVRAGDELDARYPYRYDNGGCNGGGYRVPLGPDTSVCHIETEPCMSLPDPNSDIASASGRVGTCPVIRCNHGPGRR
ncbi:hypothetical protein DFP93_102133 [Aneurinibacillus soli]|uniref:Uncharacterized protein n=1 Tax=Aneurinibacillus soli TaxID=1500254 RepID=A0A0U5C6E4_9BACL|nr:hypothetical protein DFP93_102133 [Aneurinibacillus soli]BAU27619.1 hypothetical protein CB4_01793 [Aneurinibacillus soli]